MYTTRNLDEEIDALVLEKMERREKVVPDWVTLEIVQRHLGNGTLDRYQDFATCCSWHYTRARAGIRITQATKRTRRSDSEQFEFNGVGFTDVQDYYIVNREGDDVAVPTISADGSPGMTWDEMTGHFTSMVAEGEARIRHGLQGLALRDLLYPGMGQTA